MRGFSVVEIVFGAAIVAVVTAGIAAAWQFYARLGGESARTAQAALLAEEGGEAIQYLRDKGWTANIAPLGIGTVYYLVWNGSDYILTTTQTLVNGAYKRTATFANVYRDASSNIAASGTLDPGTKLATVSIYPSAAASQPTLQAQLLIHNEFNN